MDYESKTKEELINIINSLNEIVKDQEKNIDRQDEKILVISSWLYDLARKCNEEIYKLK